MVKSFMFMAGGPAILLLLASTTSLHARQLEPCNKPDQSIEQSYRCAEAVLPQHIEELVFDISVRPRWFEDSSRFWYERHTPNGYQYVYVDPALAEKRPLFDREALVEQLRVLSGEEIQPNKFRLSGARISEGNETLEFQFRGQRYALNLADGRVSLAEGKDDPEGALSPDGKTLAFVRQHNVWLRDNDTGQERQITKDGVAAKGYAIPIINVRRMIADGSDTPDARPALIWSPDSRFVATYRMDRSDARRLSLVQSTPPDNAPPKVFEYIYSFTGDETVPTATLVTIDAQSGKVTQARGNPRDVLYYGGPGFVWAKDSSSFFSIRPGRGYKTLSLDRVDATSGEVSEIRQDQSDTYVDYYGHDWFYSDDHDRHFWTADDTGFAHVYTASGAGEEWQQLTKGDWRARYVAGLSEGGDTAYIVGSGREEGRDPYLRSLYSVSVKNGATINLTPEIADHSVSISPDGRHFVDNMSRIDMPTRSVLRETDTGAIVMELQQADVSRFTASGFTLPEPFEALGSDGETKIYGAIFKPANFDPSRTYPVIEYTYTGPHYVQTPKSFEAALRYRNVLSMAQLGAIGVTVDGRGTWGRSRAFQQPAYKNLHLVGFDDHIAAIRQMAERKPWMDDKRVGIYGFSAGGYDVVRAMTRYPDFYQVGVSASGNHDNRLDKAIWNEQWMGAELGDIYDENSNVKWASELRGKLFLAHGELDENVPPAATMRLASALIDANKDFEFLIVPNADHFLDKSPYFQRKRFDFFTRNLIGVAPPSEFEMRSFE